MCVRDASAISVIRVGRCASVNSWSGCADNIKLFAAVVAASQQKNIAQLVRNALLHSWTECIWVQIRALRKPLHDSCRLSLKPTRASTPVGMCEANRKTARVARKYVYFYSVFCYAHVVRNVSACAGLCADSRIGWTLTIPTIPNGWS